MEDIGLEQLSMEAQADVGGTSNFQSTNREILV